VVCSARNSPPEYGGSREKKLGVRLGNWLSVDQSRNLLQAPDASTIGGKRDRAVLSLVLGCGLRRGEVSNLRVRDIQQRDEHWAVVDLVGKGRHTRTVPLPDWVKASLDDWTDAAGITDGRLFRCVSRTGTIWGQGITEKVIWHIVRRYARVVGVQPLRRTIAVVHAPDCATPPAVN